MPPRAGSVPGGLHQTPVRQPPELAEPVQVRLNSPFPVRVILNVSFDVGATEVTT